MTTPLTIDPVPTPDAAATAFAQPPSRTPDRRALDLIALRKCPTARRDVAQSVDDALEDMFDNMPV